MIRVYFDGTVFMPIGAQPDLEIGNYRFLEEHELDDGFRAHFFVRLKELHDNLPERISRRFGSLTHFRAWCLIHEGFYNEVTQVYPSRAHAQGAAVDIVRAAQILSPRDDTRRYVITKVEGKVLYVWTAKSLARNGGMSNRELKRATQQVLELAEHLVAGGDGATPAKGIGRDADRSMGKGLQRH